MLFKGSDFTAAFQLLLKYICNRLHNRLNNRPGYESLDLGLDMVRLHYSVNLQAT